MKAQGKHNLYSMSGFGRAEFASERVRGYVEVKSVNHRYLKIAIKAPEGFNAYHFAVEEEIRARMARGSVFVLIHLKHLPGEQVEVLNTDAVKAYQKVFREHGLNETMLPQMPGIIEVDSLKVVDAGDWDTVREALHQALDKNVTMRVQEGVALNAEVQSILRGMQDRAKRIQNDLGRTKDAFKKSLEDRLAQYKDMVDIPEETIAREVVLFVERSDISEELARIDSHINQAFHYLSSGEPCGRSLEFLAQELLREVNTVGSKLHDSLIAKDVIELKVEIEKFREQVANLE